MSLIREWKKRGELPEDYPEPPSRLERLREKARRVKEALERRRAAAEEKAVRRAEVGAESRAARARREVGLSARREAAMARRREAEMGLGVQRGREVTAFRESREARSRRIQAERELRGEKLRPYREAGIRVARVGREVGKGVFGVAKVPFALGERLTRRTTPTIRPRHAVKREPEEELLGEKLDFGFEEPRAPKRKRKAEGLEINIFDD